MLGPGSSTVAEFARDLTVRGSESTIKLLLGNGVVADYEAALSDFPKRSDGQPLSLKGVTEAATRLSRTCIDTMERRSVAVASMPKSRRARSESVSHI